MFSEFWQKVKDCQGQEFLTIGGLPFTYRVDGGCLRVSRGGEEIERNLPRSDLEEAWKRNPEKPSGLKDLQGSSYLFGIVKGLRNR